MAANTEIHRQMQWQVQPTPLDREMEELMLSTSMPLEQEGRPSALPVLLIAYYFPPEGGAGTFRTLKFAKRLPDFGIDPVVLTVQSDLHSEHSVIDLSLMANLPSDLKVVRTGRLAGLEELVALRERSYPKGMGEVIPETLNERPWMGRVKRALKNALTNLLTTPDHAAGWLPYAVAAGLRTIQERQVACIYSTGGPWTDHLVGGVLHAITGLPWVADFRDPWTGNLGFGSVAQFPVRSAVERRLERWVLETADRIVTVSEPIREELLALSGRSPDSISVITNAYEPEEIASVVPWPRSHRFTLAHVGRLYANRSPRSFCRALRLLMARRPEIGRHLQVMMVGVIDPEHERAIREEGVSSVVRRIGHVSRRDAMRHMVSADVLLLLVHEAGEQSRGMYTGKLFEYLGAGRSILAVAPEGVARELIREEEAGLVVDPADVNGIADAIERLYDRWVVGGRDALSIHPSKLEPYSAESTTRQLAEVLQEIAGLRDAKREVA